MTKKQDTNVTPAKNAQILADDAKAIRKLGKSTIKNLIEIGRRLTRDKELVGHGNWGPWLAREFKGWSESTALKYMQSYKFSVDYKADKSVTVTDLNIGVKALFSLAAPSTTKEARDEVVERAKAGEEMTPKKVKAVVQKTKKPKTKSKTKAPKSATDPDESAANEASTTKPKPAPSKSAKALAEFKIACDIWLPQLDKDDLAKAAKYANNIYLKAVEAVGGFDKPVDTAVADTAAPEVAVQ